jgi:hypothetical protein
MAKSHSERGSTPTKLKKDTATDSNFDQAQGAVMQLYTTLRAPCLSLLKLYLGSISGRQGLQTALASFRDDHPNALRTMYVIDQLFDAFMLGLVIFVFMRGLGIIKF